MTTKLRKSDLRVCGRLALERRGYTVEVRSGRGFVPGSHLLIRQGAERRKVAVRTSLDREVGLTRKLDGQWMTIPKVDEVVVVVASDDNPGSAQVFGFDSNVFLAAFDAALAARQKHTQDLSTKAPIFLGLDDGPDGTETGLKRKAKWEALVPLSSVPSHETPTAVSPESFIERVKREFAQLNGVDVTKVVVEFRIIA